MLFLLGFVTARVIGVYLEQKDPYYLAITYIE